MPLEPMKKLLADALKGGYAVGYFEPWDQYSMEAIITAAEELNAPVIIGCGAIMMNYNWFNGWGMETLAKMGRIFAERSTVSASLILNEAASLDQIMRGLQYGFNAVMLDSAHLPFEENIRITKKVVKEAHAAGVNVEAELGRLPMGNDEPSRTELTDPDQASLFVSRTGVDALAVSVGNVHVKLNGKYTIDLNLLKKIHDKLDIPLVLHGTTGLPEDVVPQAISCGVAKFNVGTVLKKAFWDGLKEANLSTQGDANPQLIIGSRKESDILLRACNKVSLEVKRFITMFMNKTENR